MQTWDAQAAWGVSLSYQQLGNLHAHVVPCNRCASTASPHADSCIGVHPEGREHKPRTGEQYVSSIYRMNDSKKWKGRLLCHAGHDVLTLIKVPTRRTFGLILAAVVKPLHGAQGEEQESWDWLGRTKKKKNVGVASERIPGCVPKMQASKVTVSWDCNQTCCTVSTASEASPIHRGHSTQ